MSSRITKRKLDDAISNLDRAMASSSQDAPETSPSKRPNTSRTSSIYASLSKYKIFRSSTSSKAPTRTISAPYALASKPPYRPESSEDFLARLATFRITTYRDKPAEIDAVAAAKAGWVNDGKERLVCGYCTSSWVLASTAGMTSRDAANTLVEKQRVGLVSNHKDFCPWKKAQCDDSVYRIPLKAPSALAKEIKSRADVLTPLVTGLHVKHPLTPKEVSSLTETVKLVAVTEEHKRSKTDDATDDPLPPQQMTDPEAAASDQVAIPSETAIILALFGWDNAPYPSSPASTASSYPGSYSRGTTPLSSRATTPSPLPPTAGPTTLRHAVSLSRASGQHYGSAARSDFRLSMPVQARGSSEFLPQYSSPPKPVSVRTISGGSTTLTESRLGSARRNASGGSTGSALEGVREGCPINAVLQCQFCLRRVGLWSFRSDIATNESLVSVAGQAPSVGEGETGPSTETFPVRSLDVVKEHRNYCPYVTRSTVVPVPVFSEPLQRAPLSRSASVGSGGSLRKSLSSSLSNALLSGGSVRSKPDSNEPIEGWKALLTLVGRAGMGLRFRRTGSTAQVSAIKKDARRPSVGGRSTNVSFAVPSADEQSGGSPSPNSMDVDGPTTRPIEPDMEVDDSEDANVNGGVEKIVENVKKTKDGSRELLRYVKDLLRRGDPPPTPSRSYSSPNPSRASICLPIRPRPSFASSRAGSPSSVH
ncbi:hypothetical protein FS837_011130 [Tulasnella sp. UAMH 9824]|nr:hypothetical protein FS837_011130 [Tulasnella sp. UAMH 9824]